MRATACFAQAPAGSRGRTQRDQEAAFTLVELLVVISTLAILASLLLPTLGKAKSTAQSSGCGNNFRQLQMAWHMYTMDNNDVLPANKWMSVNWEDGCPDGFQTTSDSWVLGNATVDTQTWNIQNGCLFSYTKEPQLYHCAADRSTVAFSHQITRTRSYSMSYYMNGSDGKPERKTKLSQIKSTSNAFVFIEEHEDSINDGVFFVHVPGDAGEQSEATNNPTFGGAHWMDLPAGRHNQGCNLSFADGSAKHWKWLWPKVVNPNNPDVVNQQDFQDMRRLQAGIPAR